MPAETSGEDWASGVRVGSGACPVVPLACPEASGKDWFGEADGIGVGFSSGSGVGSAGGSACGEPVESGVVEGDEGAEDPEESDDEA